MVGIWGIASGIIALSVFYATLSMYSIAANLKKRVWISVEADTTSLSLPKVSVLLPFYREGLEHIETTFKSIAAQTYPRDLMEVYAVLERDDPETHRHVDMLRGYLERSNVDVRIAVNNSSRSSKAAAVNSVLSSISGEVVVIFDAGDAIADSHYIAKVAKLVRSGYSVVGCKVYRSSRGVLGSLSLIDTVLWYNVALPGLTVVAKYPLVSGEGMALSREFLRMINGLPDKLTEDSYITVLAAKHGRRIALLDTVVYEGAPSSLSGLIKQRLRWYRGYVECLRDLLLLHSRGLSKTSVLKLLIVYTQPLALLSLPVAMVVVVASAAIDVDPYTLTLAILALLMTFFAPIYVMLGLRIKDASILVAPVYWVFQGLIVVASLLPVRIRWLRTERSSTLIPSNRLSAPGAHT